MLWMMGVDYIFNVFGYLILFVDSIKYVVVSIYYN